MFSPDGEPLGDIEEALEELLEEPHEEVIILDGDDADDDDDDDVSQDGDDKRSKRQRFVAGCSIVCLRRCHAIIYYFVKTYKFWQK